MTVSVSILGATGSIGCSAADVLLQHRDRFRVECVVGGRDVSALAAMARKLDARAAAIADPAAYEALRAALSGTDIVAMAGPNGVIEAAQRDCDIVVGAIVGTAGLRPTHAALAKGRRIALANKECLVTAGAAFMRDVRRIGATVAPLDSEHNAIFQALGGAKPETVERVTITASGGPFRTWDSGRIATARVEDALAHPTWSMGAKITIDSASLMNKGLELIEAHHLFSIPPDRLDVVVHPQSVVHGLVAFRDGSVVAVLAAPDMRVATAHCLGMPERLATQTKRLDLATIGALEFMPPDLGRFPALQLAIDAMREGGVMPTVLNAANEVAVEAFLARRLPFGGVPRLVAEMCEAFGRRQHREPQSIDEALEIDGQVRARAASVLPDVAKTAS